MAENIPETDVVVSLVASGAIGLISYFLICSAFRPRGWSAGALTDHERYVAIGLAVIIFLVVLYRMCRGAWKREQTGELLDFDDTSL